jgi:putative DNA primase/helicase
MIEVQVRPEPQAGPAEKLLALYAQAQASPETEAASIAAADKLTFEMIGETARWRKAGLRAGDAKVILDGEARPVRDFVWGAESVRDWWLSKVKQLCGEREAEEFKVRWEKAFAEGAPSFAEKLNAELAERAKAKAQPEPEPEPEPEGEPEPEAEPEAEEPKAASAKEPKAKGPDVEFAHDPPPEFPDTEPALLSVAAPFDNAREYAKRHCWKEGSLAVYAWREKVWEWNERAYVTVSEADFKAGLYGFLDRSVRISDNSRARFRPKPKDVTALLESLKAGLALPDWCEPPMRLDTGERVGGVLMFRNGLVEVMSGERVAPTPKLWVHDDVGYEWRPEAECPEWLRFLEGVFPGDQEAKDCLEEFLGLSMTEDVSFQKGLLLIGVPRSGKGTSLRVCEWLGGSKAFISLDLDKWVENENSGAPLIGKRVLAFPDVRLKEPRWYGQNLDPGGVDYKSAQRLLKITGGDKITLGRKYIGPWEGVLPGKVLWVSNKVPNFNDAVLPTRFVKLAFDVSFLNREDLALSDRLRGSCRGSRDVALPRIAVHESAADLSNPLRANGSIGKSRWAPTPSPNS